MIHNLKIEYDCSGCAKTVCRILQKAKFKAIREGRTVLIYTSNPDKVQEYLNDRGTNYLLTENNHVVGSNVTRDYL